MSDTRMQTAEVWVVDDDPEVATHLEFVVARAGFEPRVRRFTSAAQLDGVEGGAPDLVLVDQLLPDARGSEVLRRVLQRHAVATVRLITAAPDEIDDVDRAIGVVSKPPSVAVIRSLLELRRR